MKNIILIYSITSLLCFKASALEANDKNVLVKYKKYESFDLGNLEIKGKIIAPGDLTVKERARKVFAETYLTVLILTVKSKETLKISDKLTQ